MTACKTAPLTSRSVVAVGGDDANEFLQNLVTNDITRATTDSAIHAALLTPQGKILFDFLVVRHGDRFLLDTPKALTGDLIKRLTFYRLRAKVELEDLSSTHSVHALWGGQAKAPDGVNLYKDTRHDNIGYRLIHTGDDALDLPGCEQSDEADYHAHRIQCGVPEGGLDFEYGDTFPHEADLDQLDGIDFGKGCYIGQEVVSRMQHRGTARKRIVPVQATGDLDAGAAVTADDSSLGVVGSVAGSNGLALLRLDRAEKALGDGKTLMAGDTPIKLLQPGWASFTVPGAVSENR